MEADWSERVVDEAKIRDCLARYARGIDRMDRPLIEGAYWPDAYDRHALFAGSVEGFCDWVMSLLASEKATSHMLGQSLFRFNADRAAVETYYFAQHLRQGESGETVLATAGRYADLFEERQGEWRILERDVLIDWTSLQALTGNMDDAVFVGPEVRGRRAGDHSYQLLP